jgi:hypothetical protein
VFATAITLALCARPIAAQTIPVGQSRPQQFRYGTHDWTPNQQNFRFREGFVDSKAPGDGRVYTVGTVTIEATGDAANPAVFSGAPVFPAESALTAPPPAMASTFALTTTRQYGIFQVVDAASNATLLQRFYYGAPGGGLVPLRATVMRGISVWPGATEAATRVAVCGESFDSILPASQLGVVGWPLLPAALNNTRSGGFIAVLDGSLRLLWSHHFVFDRPFSTVSPGDSSAVTDVSIRVDPVTGAEIVTYCGISSFGNAAAPVGFPADPLTPTAFFPVFTPACGAPFVAGGNVDNGPGQWDGFVGRLQRLPAAASATTVFHAIVGGAQQDGLFGLAELSASSFAVVGTVGGPSSTVLTTFPFTGAAAPCSTPAPVGAVLVFDALPGPALSLLVGEMIGSGAQATCARDIAVSANWRTQVGSIQDLLVVVGGSNDPTVVGPTPGTADGYLRQFIWNRPNPTQPGVLAAVVPTLTFGGPQDPGGRPDGLFGVHSWSDFQDYFAVAGVTGRVTGPNSAAHDILVATVNANVVAPAPILVRQVAVGGAGDDRVAELGEVVANPPAPSFIRPGWDDFGLGNPQGGGVCMDSSARVTVVGATDSPASVSFPATDRQRMTLFTTPTALDPLDAVRATFDMLPVGVGRTDGTGTLDPTPFPLAGSFGGTTPECGLKPFGWRIGDTTPGVRRILLDYWDPAPGPLQPVNIIVTRPPSAIALAAWQFGFPGGGGTTLLPPLSLPQGVLLWTPGSALLEPVLPGIAETSWPASALSLPPLGGLPPGSATFTIQLVCLLGSAVVPGGSTGPGVCAGVSDLIASPALWLRY